MNSKTILSLYNGDYSCIERPIPKDSKYAKSLSKCTDLQEKLAQLVDKDTFSSIEKVLEYQSELSAIEMEEVFTEGFSLAVSLLLEALSKKYFLPPLPIFRNFLHDSPRRSPFSSCRN